MFPSQDGSMSFRDSPHLPVDSGRECSVSFSETHGPYDPSCECVGSIRQHLLLGLEGGRGQGAGGRRRGVAGRLVDHDGVQSIQLHRNYYGLDQSWSLILSYQTRLYLPRSFEIASLITRFPGSR